MNEKRGAVRTRVALKVKVSKDQDHWFFRTVDVSDAGILIAAGEPVLCVDDEVFVQVQDLPGEAPVLAMRVVRTVEDGFALMFVRED